jgi:hypothetical protein
MTSLAITRAALLPSCDGTGHERAPVVGRRQRRGLYTLTAGGRGDTGSDGRPALWGCYRSGRHDGTQGETRIG